jgi:hypothetical protein
VVFGEEAAVVLSADAETTVFREGEVKGIIFAAPALEGDLGRVR